MFKAKGKRKKRFVGKKKANSFFSARRSIMLEALVEFRDRGNDLGAKSKI